MTWQAFVLALISAFVQLASSLAWPMTVVVVVFSFREAILSQFGRIEKVSARGVELVFSKALDKIGEVNGSTSQHEGKAGILITKKVSLMSPMEIVEQSWQSLEAALRSSDEGQRAYAEDLSRWRIMPENENVPMPYSVDALLNRLMRYGCFSRSFYDLLTNLRNLRDIAQANAGNDLSIDSALRFQAYVDHAVKYLNGDRNVDLSLNGQTAA